MHIKIEQDELRTLAVDISAAPGRMQRNATKTVIKGARRLTREMKVDAGGHRYLPRLAEGVDYELLTSSEAEIGIRPRNRKQGSLAHIMAYGSINNAPVFDKNAGIARSQRDIDRMFAEAAEQSVLGGDGAE